MPLDMAVQSFGGFLRYHVSSCETPQEPQQSRVDAFQIMMSNVRHSHSDFLGRRNLLETKRTEQDLVKMLTDCLWHIDGQHDSIKKQSRPVPPIFGPFTVYNVPERSKHRKGTTSNLSSDILKAVSSSLFSLLQKSYWKHQPWQNFGNEVGSLAGSLAQYADYLERQNKKSKLRHASVGPVRQL